MIPIDPEADNFDPGHAGGSPDLAGSPPDPDGFEAVEPEPFASPALADPPDAGETSSSPTGSPSVPLRHKRPAPSGPRTLTHQLRSLVRLVAEREDITMYEVAKRAGLDPKMLSRFLAGKPGRGLSMATADRLALLLGLRLVEGGRPAAPTNPPKRKPGPRKSA